MMEVKSEFVNTYKRNAMHLLATYGIGEVLPLIISKLPPNKRLDAMTASDDDGGTVLSMLATYYNKNLVKPKFIEDQPLVNAVQTILESLPTMSERLSVTRTINSKGKTKQVDYSFYLKKMMIEFLRDNMGLPDIFESYIMSVYVGQPN